MCEQQKRDRETARRICGECRLRGVVFIDSGPCEGCERIVRLLSGIRKAERAPFLALLDAYDDALCARKHGGVAAGECVDGLRTLLGVGGFERRREVAELCRKCGSPRSHPHHRRRAFENWEDTNAHRFEGVDSDQYEGLVE